MAKFTINIDDRTAESLKEFCKTNNIKVNDYLSKIVVDKFMIDRYGDMNKMLSPKVPTALKPLEHKDNRNVSSKPVEGFLIGEDRESGRIIESAPLEKEPVVKKTKRKLVSK